MKIEVLSHEVRGIRRVTLELPSSATIGSALAAAGLGRDCDARVGIFGRLCGVDEAITEGARVEVYRALLADPKQIRRQRARIRHPQA
ncbi:MAG: RnfH family protein [Nevskia sp.]|nr:RnfH family protein [Nevskia sp.]